MAKAFMHEPCHGKGGQAPYTGTHAQGRARQTGDDLPDRSMHSTTLAQELVLPSMEVTAAYVTAADASLGRGSSLGTRSRRRTS